MKKRPGLPEKLSGTGRFTDLLLIYPESDDSAAEHELRYLTKTARG